MIKQSTFLLALCASPAFADPAKVQHVSVAKRGDSYTFNVTIRHSDTGWDDYADAWRIKDMDGKVLGERILAHPHVNEQPFTRSLSGVKIPDGLKEVVVQARDSVTGWAEMEKTVKLP
ncbi:hypothetical protein Z948_1804 [Sulfitobacter donghicola DSW-25 = KCTC 12864 = JCM 14565]|uniref:Uncharacterized protein n=2 Tax=Sulfitobacter TaxID=60136 RepID=A0A073IKE1_9RHOB|nr:hypothetical protein DSW25_02575 [Sulfitobacter donghicola DSW-25 = KCTC 12864 = JCM 14565]KIN68077.1 hypothetical protein Z948_1804 [Sulfitobacter donghicola DSW-25 = KCTC 12864 = JCM 14565]